MDFLTNRTAERLVFLLVGDALTFAVLGVLVRMFAGAGDDFGLTHGIISYRQTLFFVSSSNPVAPSHGKMMSRTSDVWNQVNRSTLPSDVVKTVVRWNR